MTRKERKTYEDGKDAIRRRNEKALLRELRDALNMAGARRTGDFRKVYDTLLRALSILDPQGEFGWKNAVSLGEYLGCLRVAAFNAASALESTKEELETKDAELEEMDAQLREMAREVYLAMEALYCSRAGLQPDEAKIRKAKEIRAAVLAELERLEK